MHKRKLEDLWKEKEKKLAGQRVLEFQSGRMRYMSEIAKGNIDSVRKKYDEKIGDEKREYRYLQIKHIIEVLKNIFLIK